MDLNQTTRYAFRLMSFMASSDVQYLSSADIHYHLGIPMPYLRRLMTRLSKKGLLKSEKGRSGGYSLARSKEEIYLSEIILATDESQFLQACILGFDNCRLASKCVLHDKWAEARLKVLEIFQTINLAEMSTKFVSQ